MLLVSENDVVEFSVFYLYKEGKLEFLDADAQGASTETFVFRRPTWQDMKTINSASIVVDPLNGKPTLDLYRYMDMKVKTLLKSWSLKNEKDEPLPATVISVNKLNPDLMQAVFAKMEEVMGSSDIAN